MRTEWIHRANNPSLVVLVLGWACDKNSATHFSCQGHDILCLYDYRELNPEQSGLAQTLRSYKKVLILAWSFGVWATEQLWETLSAGNNVSTCIAVNGTPLPVDAAYGIPPKAFELTVRSIKKAGLNKFYERTYLEELEKTLAEHMLPQRPLEEQIEELKTLAGYFATQPPKNCAPWNIAVIGERDLIFPPENMQAYWEQQSGVTIVATPLPHFPFGAEGRRILKDLLRRDT